MLLPETLKLHDREVFEFHYIYFLPWKNQMEESIRNHGGKVTCFNARDNIRLMLKARRVAAYVKDNGIELIHSHLPWAGILSRIVGKMTGIPVLYTEHNKLERYHVGTRFMNLATMNLLTGLIAVSNDVADSIRKHKPGLKPILHTVLNGVNTEYFRRNPSDGEDIRKRYNIPATAPVIGTIAVFRFQKRLDLWMELAAKILAEKKDAHFIMVGDGPLKNELIRKRSALGLGERLHLPGLQTEVRPFLSAFDIYMMSSVFEGLPVALLEAMSMECAIISTNAGGIKEVVRHEKDGLVCDADKPYELVDYAITLMDDEALRTSLATEARKRVKESFSMKKMVSELEGLYKTTFLTKK